MSSALLDQSTNHSGRPLVASDLKLIRRAIKEGWAIPEPMKQLCVDRMQAILRKDTVSVPSKDGVIEVDSVADANAIRAAGVLVAMAGQNQTDYWNQDKNDRLDAGRATERIGAVEIHVPGVPQSPVGDPQSQPCPDTVEGEIVAPGASGEDSQT